MVNLLCYLGIHSWSPRWDWVRLTPIGIEASVEFRRYCQRRGCWEVEVIVAPLWVFREQSVGSVKEV